jgi:N utilization substance protein A
VQLRDSDHTALVTVPERQLSLAIGKDGQNARLAAKLTGWRVDVTKPVEGEVYDEPVEERREASVSSYSGRRDRERGERSQGRNDRGSERGRSGGRSHQRGNRNSGQGGYDD